MSILSFQFFVFTAALVLLYYLLPLRLRKWVLLAGSAVFWLSHGVSGTLYLLGETALVWGCARFIAFRRARGHSGRTALVLTVILAVGAMMLVKEGGFLPLPIGLSYFTFQSLGYLIEVWRGKAEPQRNYLKLLLFCGFFPQLGQGPIGLYRDLFPQLDAPHRLEPQNCTAGFIRMAWGCFKKLVIADRITPFVTAALSAAETLPGWAALLTVIAYTIALYADFSGGIDLVCGLAELFGIRLAENFARPFFAVSVADYWRRWHISLGAWFRSYVLYPLATSRLGAAVGRIGRRLFGPKTGSALPGAFAAFAVFVLIGLWHALRWNALLYGVWFGLLSAGAILAEPLFKRRRKHLGFKKGDRRLKALGMVRTWLLILPAQFLACSASVQQAGTLMSRVILHFDAASFGRLSSLTFITFDAAEWIVAAAALLVLAAVDILCECRKDILQRLAGARMWIRWPLLILLLLSILIFGRYGVGQDAAAFVYAGF